MQAFLYSEVQKSNAAHGFSKNKVGGESDRGGLGGANTVPEAVALGDEGYAGAGQFSVAPSPTREHVREHFTA